MKLIKQNTIKSRFIKLLKKMKLCICRVLYGFGTKTWFKFNLRNYNISTHDLQLKIQYMIMPYRPAMLLGRT